METTGAPGAVFPTVTVAVAGFESASPSVAVTSTCHTSPPSVSVDGTTSSPTRSGRASPATLHAIR